MLRSRRRTRIEAKAEYLLKNSNFDKRGPPLLYISRKNTHKVQSVEMKLYLNLQVEQRAMEVWGDEKELMQQYASTNPTHIRHITLYHFEKEGKAAQSCREDTTTASRCREWFAHFKSGDTSLQDKSGGGRPPGTFASRGRGRKLDNSNVASMWTIQVKFGKVCKLAG
uniref:Mos1 transposase HTH domain-containing protein n=1 Tax=Glossina austeni TaxID=7395 RepID=A0A1A9V387_GLOAU